MAWPATAIERDLRALLEPESLVVEGRAAYLADETEGRGLVGRAEAVVLPGSTEEVAKTLAWCYAHEVPVVPRGGGTGFAGGAVPLDGGVVLGLDRLTAIRSFEPLLWRMCVEAGRPTADVRRLAMENGLFLPPDPGAAEQSQIGGNIATNAGGPHAFKYGVTGAWVTGLEAVIPPGEVVSVGGPIRKDVAGYDLKSLLIGSEGTLGIVTAAWLKLLPAPEAALPVAAFYTDAAEGCAAIERVLGNGLLVAALEYLDAAALEAAGAAFPEGRPRDAGFLVIAEADGAREEAERLRDELVEVLGEGALAVQAPSEPTAIAGIWRWRDGVSIAVTAQRGGKVSEDIVVPLDRLREAIEETLAIGRRHDLSACSWGHAGDGNLHSTFFVAPDHEEELSRAQSAAEELFALALRLGGSISGEHGVGLVKRGQLARQWAPRALALHEEIKRAFDPKGLLNPGKKVARVGSRPDARGRAGDGDHGSADGAESAARRAPRERRGVAGSRLVSPLPIERPGKIVCVGLNYRDHAAEQGVASPEHPILFAKWQTALTGPGEPIVLPPVTSQVDYEAELGVVIGERVRDVSEDEALEAVRGYVCVNEVSARDLQFADGQWTRAKSIDTFCPVGPRLVPREEIPDPQALGIRCLVNGEVMQDSSTAEMIFGVANVIAFASRTMTLEPGDLIATGTPAGVGFTREPPVFLEDGDEVTVEIEGLGALTNPVRREG